MVNRLFTLGVWYSQALPAKIHILKVKKQNRAFQQLEARFWVKNQREFNP